MGSVSTFMIRARTALLAGGAILVIVAVGIATAFAVGVVGVPATTTEDPRFATDESDSVVIRSTLTIDNPNVVSPPTEVFRVNQTVTVNGVQMGDIDEDIRRVPRGTTHHIVEVPLEGQTFVTWWVGYVDADETLHLSVHDTSSYGVGPIRTDQAETMTATAFANETPILATFDLAVQDIAGRYAMEGLSPEMAEVTVMNPRVEWHIAETTRSTLRLSYAIRNTGQLHVPTVPISVSGEVTVDGTTVFDIRGTPERIAGSSSIGAREGDNMAIGIHLYPVDLEPLLRHYSGNERSHVAVQLRLEYLEETTGIRYTIPETGYLEARCTMQSDLVTEQEAGLTACEERSSAE